MTSLSYLIYFIGFADAAGTIVGWGIGIGAILAFVSTIGYFACNNEPSAAVAVKSTINHIRIFAYFLFGVSMLLHIVVPTRQTMVLIAASEVGQRIISSDQAKAAGNRAMDILDPATNLLSTYIQKELVEEKKELAASVEPKKNTNAAAAPAASADAIAAATDAASKAAKAAFDAALRDAANKALGASR